MQHYKISHPSERNSFSCLLETKRTRFAHVQQSTQKRQVSSFCFILYIRTTQHHTSQTQRSRHKTTKMKLTQHILKPLLALYLVVSAEAKIRVCVFFRCVVGNQKIIATLHCSVQLFIQHASYAFWVPSFAALQPRPQRLRLYIA